MFYEPKNQNHGLPKNPFNSLVIPRPIGWISSIDSEGVFNLAPYSFFNAVCYRPQPLCFQQVQAVPMIVTRTRPGMSKLPVSSFAIWQRGSSESR